MSNGSLFFAMGTAVVPKPGLCDFHAFSPSGVNGNSCSGFPSDGYCFGPVANTPSRYPGVGSQIPLRSRTGAGADAGSVFGDGGTIRSQPSRCMFLPDSL